MEVTIYSKVYRMIRNYGLCPHCGDLHKIIGLAAVGGSTVLDICTLIPCDVHVHV